MSNDYFSMFEAKLELARETRDLKLLSDLHSFLFKSKNLPDWKRLYTRYREISDEVIVLIKRDRREN